MMNNKVDFFLLVVIFSIVSSRDNLKLVLIGQTGVGKSQLGNFILGKNAFSVGHRGNSETKGFHEQTSYIEYLKNDVTIVDTQGLNDPETDDNKIMNLIISKFQNDKCIDGIILVYSWANNRISKKDKDLIENLKNIFGEDIIKKRLKVIFTHRPIGEEYEIEKDKVEYKIKDTIELLNKMVSDKDIIFVNTHNTKSNKESFYPEIQKLLENFYETKGKHGSMDNELINKNLKLKKDLKKKEYEKEIEKLDKQIEKTKKKIIELETKIQHDKAGSLASGLTIPFTLGLSAIGMNHCAENRVRHEKELLLEKEKLEQLNGEKWYYQYYIKNL